MVAGEALRKVSEPAGPILERTLQCALGLSWKVRF